VQFFHCAIIAIHFHTFGVIAPVANLVVLPFVCGHAFALSTTGI
jgi:hypothetical protein